MKASTVLTRLGRAVQQVRPDPDTDNVYLVDYVRAHEHDIAAAFGVTPSQLRDAVSAVDPAQLPDALEEQIQLAREEAKAAKTATVQLQGAWRGDSVRLAWPDVVGRLQTTPWGMWSFVGPWDTPVYVRQRAVSGLRRMRPVWQREIDAVWIDREGMHVRWGGGRGGLNLRAQPQPCAGDGVPVAVVELTRAPTP